MTDVDFAWLLGESPTGSVVLDLPRSAIGTSEVLAMLREITRDLSLQDDRPLAWLASEAGTLVAMLSFTRRGEDGRYELGYGAAPDFQGRGVMTRAIATLLPLLSAQGHDGLTAETSIDNPASQRVLERNGFSRIGTRDDPEDGALICWAIDLK